MKSKVRYWRYSLRYLYESRFFILAAVVLFLISSLVGFFYSESFSFFDAMLQEILAQTEGLNTFQLIIFIFQNNLLSAFLALFLGVFLGLFSIGNALLNGAVVGYVIARAAPIAGIGVIWRLVPHGVFELPAIFIAIGLGIKLGFFIFSSSPRAALYERLRGAGYVFLTVILPLLIIAACIEGILIHFF